MSASTSYPTVYQPFGLPIGSVRGFLSLLICSFFWIVLLQPEPIAPPLGHFFLLTLVFLAFASNPHHADPERHGHQKSPAGDMSRDPTRSLCLARSYTGPRGGLRQLRLRIR